ncbi:hypothetical protein HAX54_043610 [Datura stramonium]|uniref:Uncharacterized protein n=1 Tax=Datura stramonium TaxID=4076 RepID=A0ABS8SPQ3_DATST|nr:hypothetical protein [Datura stramonium]
MKRKKRESGDGGFGSCQRRGEEGAPGMSLVRVGGGSRCRREKKRGRRWRRKMKRGEDGGGGASGFLWLLVEATTVKGKEMEKKRVRVCGESDGFPANSGRNQWWFGVSEMGEGEGGGCRRIKGSGWLGFSQDIWVGSQIVKRVADE